MTFLELIDAYAEAGHDPTRQALRAEIERRLNLAGADHHLAIWRHLNDGEPSQRRQRSLLDNAKKDLARGSLPSAAIQYIEKSVVDEWEKAQ